MGSSFFLYRILFLQSVNQQEKGRLTKNIQ